LLGNAVKQVGDSLHEEEKTMADEKTTEVVVRDRSDIGIALAFFGLGALVGATAALLLATQSGAETRDDVKRGFGELRERVASLANQVGETFERVRAKIEERRHHAAAPANDTKTEAPDTTTT
jgi:gas vesicle protein